MVTLTMRRLWIPVLMMLLGITASEGEWQFPSGFFFFFSPILAIAQYVTASVLNSS